MRKRILARAACALVLGVLAAANANAQYYWNGIRTMRADGVDGTYLGRAFSADYPNHLQKIDQVTYEEAKDGCSKLRFEGYDDWRLGTLEEVLKLLDPDVHLSGKEQWDRDFTAAYYANYWLSPNADGVIELSLTGTIDKPPLAPKRIAKPSDMHPSHVTEKHYAICVRASRLSKQQNAAPIVLQPPKQEPPPQVVHWVNQAPEKPRAPTAEERAEYAANLRERKHADQMAAEKAAREAMIAAQAETALRQQCREPSFRGLCSSGCSKFYPELKGRKVCGK